MPDVVDRAIADCSLGRKRPKLQVLVEVGEFDSFIGLKRHEWRLTRFQRPSGKSTQTPSVICETAESELAEFTVADDVNPRMGLFADDIDDPAPHLKLQRLRVYFPTHHQISGDLH